MKKSNAGPEYLDILDENGNAAGRIKQRSRVHFDGDWHRTAHMWIEDGQGSVLIQKRGPHKFPYPDMWDVSCAGHVRAGDSSRKAALREADEELGMRISPLELRFLGTVRDSFTDGNTHDNEIVDIFVVQRAVDPKRCRLQDDEVADVRLIAVDDLKERIQNNDPAFVPHRHEYQKLFAFLGERNYAAK